MSKLDHSCRTAEGVLTLLGLPGVGPRTASVLAHEFETLDDIARHASAQDGVSTRAEQAVRDKKNWAAAADKARRTIEKAAELGVQIVTNFDDAFPPLLRALPDGPLVLYVKGHLRNDLRNVACIGTREPSEFGVEVTRRLVAILVNDGWGIVSGLAKGIDAHSHRAALDSVGYTVAVLANGLDKVYPSENRRLADEIVERGGALISEQSFGVPATPPNLVQRDRLQSGMSIATVVMQTDLKGGSMHTVRFTLSQGRLLVAPVPRGRHAEEEKSRGILALTEHTGAALADMLKVSGDYRDILVRRFAKVAPAFAVRSRRDYPSLLEELSIRLASAGGLERLTPQKLRFAGPAE
ncbi:DNA-protecting protein DprA [Isosphaeraceae bacterium EP7]